MEEHCCFPINPGHFGIKKPQAREARNLAASIFGFSWGGPSLSYQHHLLSVPTMLGWSEALLPLSVQFGSGLS
jgi:hypothetical protein